jgi:hypothetical protein
MASVLDFNFLLNEITSNKELIDNSKRSEIIASISHYAKESEELQDTIGQSNAIDLLFHLLLSIDFYKEDWFDYSLETVCSLFTALIGLCRRDIFDKSTANKANIEKVGLVIEKLTSLPEICYLIHEQVAASLCILFMILASDSEVRQKALAQQGFISIISKIVEKFKSNPMIIEFVCRAIRNVSNDEDSAYRLADDGVAQIIESLLQHPSISSDPKALEALLWAVVNLSHVDDIAAILGSTGCCHGLVHACRSWLDVSVTIATAFCWALRNLSCTNLNFGSIVATDACEILVRGIGSELWREDTDAVQSALWCVANLSCNREVASRFIECGIIEAMIPYCSSRMRLVENDLEMGPVAEATMFAVRNLLAAYNQSTQSSSSELNSSAASHHSAAAANAEKKETAVHSANNENDVRVAGDRFGVAGSCELAIAVMQRYMDREGMVEACCWAIAGLADGCASNQRRFICSTEADAFSAVLKALEIHKNTPETVEIGLKCLIKVVSNMDDDIIARLEGNSAIRDQILTHCVNHHTDYDICTASCEMLLQLYRRAPPVRAELLSKGQIDATSGKATPRGRYADIAAAWGLLLPAAARPCLPSATQEAEVADAAPVDGTVDNSAVDDTRCSTSEETSFS